jgi:hypothetical protein
MNLDPQHLKPLKELTTMIRRLAFLFIACLFWLVATQDSYAQTASAGAAARANAAKGGNGKRTTINFEDQLVEGQTQKPELFYLLQQRNNNFKRLIRLRENFLPEMRKTSEDVGRRAGGDN